jgi:hypothetical protein
VLQCSNGASPFDSMTALCQSALAKTVNRRPSLMTMQSHLAELEKRHQALEREIEEALAHPSTDTLALTELKRRKLVLKDEIAKLKSASIH